MRPESHFSNAYELTLKIFEKEIEKRYLPKFCQFDSNREN